MKMLCQMNLALRIRRLPSFEAVVLPGRPLVLLGKRALVLEMIPVTGPGWYFAWEASGSHGQDTIWVYSVTRVLGS